MRYIITFFIGFAAFAVSVFAFAQIIGSVQHRYERGAKMTCITIVINLIILAFAVFAVLTWLNSYKIAALIGALIGFFSLPKNIE